MRKYLLLFFWIVTLSAPFCLAQTMDPDFAASVKEWTTKPEFLSPLVEHLPKGSAVPSPKDVLGYHIGAPKQLTYYTDILGYYRKLESTSKRVKVLSIGKTEEDRESVIVFVGSEDSIAHLEENRKNLARLADPRGLREAEARDLISRTKPLYTLSGGLHSAELGPPEMLMELAYRLITEDSPLIQKIRSEVIVAIMPVADPDGRDRSIDWYFRNKIDITDYEEASQGGVPYWGKYFKHDNNRDINYAAESNRNLLKWYLEWHPPIMHDLHESVPFLYIYSGQAPQNPLFDPIVWGELPLLSNWDMSQLTKYGMPGVWTHGYVDAWSPGYVAGMSTNHNGLMRFYEIFGNGGATTMKRTLPAANPTISGTGGPLGDLTKRQWFRPSPPYRDVLWSMRNNTNYAETGVLTSLQFVSQFPQVLLENFYAKSRNALTAGAREAPFGFILPADQEDPTRVAFVIQILRMQGIEVGRTRAPLKLSDGEYPTGSLIVKSNQPYGRLAKTLLGRQDDPNPELTTYDDSAWTMSLMTNTVIKPTADVAIQKVVIDSVDQYKPIGQVSDLAGASVYAVPDHGSPSMITLRYGLKSTSVRIAEKAFTVKDVRFPAGTFLVAGNSGQTLIPLARELGLDVIALQASPQVAAHEAALPRIAMFSTWGGTQDVGWVRYTFDQYKVPYDLIFKERVLQGHLDKDYDLLLIPNQMRTSKALVTDLPQGKRPLPYTKTAKFKFLGDYGASEDITGGMGAAGVAELEKFTEGGGVLVTLGTSSALPADLGLAPWLDTSTPSARFYAPGPVVEAEILHPENPIFYGYSTKTVPVRYANGPLLRMPADRDQSDVLMRFPGGEKTVLSGLFNGADEIKGRAAVVVSRVGKGEAVLFATNPVWRWQNLGEYRMMFNTLMNYRQLGSSGPSSSNAADRAHPSESH